jgi:hypothetical protein
LQKSEHHKANYKNFPINPQRGACVIINKVIAQTINARTNLLLILRTQLLFFAEDTRLSLFEIGYCLKEKIGKTTAGKKENSIILTEQSSVRKILPFVVEQNSQAP